MQRANLNRSIRTPRFPIVASGVFGRLTPYFRHLVEPGSTLKKYRMNMRLASVPCKNVLTGATIDYWMFYVPLSYIWDDFEAYMMGDDTITEPQTNADDRLFQ